MELNLDWRRETSTLWPEVGYELRPLKVWAFEALLSHWEQRREGAQDISSLTSALDGVRIMEVARRIFPEHVRAVEGLNIIKEGQSAPATTEALCEETQLLPLAGEIISRLMAISEIGGEEEKN